MIRKHNFKRAYLVDIFSKARKPVRFRTKKRHRKVIKGVAKGRNWRLRKAGFSAYEKKYLNEDRVRQGVKFVKRYKTLFEKIEKKFKVDRYTIAAIIGIESYYGEIVGNWETFNVLAYNAFKKRKRSRLFKYELENLLLLSYRQKLRADLLKGSVYGALGLGQLMPHSYIKYGVSFDGNKKIEPFSRADAIATVANFLHKKGWKLNRDVALRARYSGRHFSKISKSTRYRVSRRVLKKWGLRVKQKFKAKYFKLLKLKRAEFDEVWLTFNNFDVLKKYNNSDCYAMSVYQLAQEIKKRAGKKAARKAVKKGKVKFAHK